MHEATLTAPSAAVDRQHSESLFSRLLARMVDAPPATLSFEDLTGVSLDNPQLSLPYHFRIHTCRFCMFAKANPDSHQHCVRNKMAANRLAIRRRQGFIGQCHLGLTDLVKPLVFQDTVLGVFYYGSFVLAGTEEAGRRRIEKFCRRHGFDAVGYIDSFERAPRIETSRIPELWARLDLTVDLVNCIVESIGVPVGRYRTRPGAQFSTWNGAMSSLVRTVIAHINRHYAEDIRIKDLAAQHKCNADYLSRIFKRTVGFGIVEYLHRVRVDHARRLLQTDRFSVGEVGHLVGFPDQSHFGKVFRKFVGLPPQAFRAAVQSKDTLPKAFSAFEYSNIRPFNPKFSEGLVDPKRLVM
jgi:AraC-like DNA-binding protein/ligand-binding sensor protein